MTLNIYGTSNCYITILIQMCSSRLVLGIMQLGF